MSPGNLVDQSFLGFYIVGWIYTEIGKVIYTI